jgi:hypothetical protein
VKFSLNDEYHSLLVFAFVGETRIMTLGQEVEEVGTTTQMRSHFSKDLK